MLIAGAIKNFSRTDDPVPAPCDYRFPYSTFRSSIFSSFGSASENLDYVRSTVLSQDRVHLSLRRMDEASMRQ